ncbi:MAG: efflux RND transporter periplasmic adaptor subunit [Alphaproteobacteria bacterium]|nr:MAG: efflux RND transporter periplasmic adaptor subunit [Alphaproteobacteria bacterium]
MTRRRWIVLGVILAGVAGWLLWRALNPPPVIDPYKTAAIARGDLTEEITANGVINPVRVVSVGTQVSGTVQSLYADFNDRVVAGQILLRLDPALFISQLQSSQASLANARATAALQAANARRAAELVTRDYISRQDYETTLASAKTSAASVAQAEARVRLDAANLEFSVIRSPVSGIVISRQIDIGQTVAAAFSTPTLFQIARDLTQMQIEASVAEADIARVKPGQAVNFTVDAYGARQFRGTVQQIRLNPTTQQNVVTYTVIVMAANPDGALLPGMTANASFIVAEKRNVVLLPNAALSFKPEGWKPVRAARNRPRDPDEVTVFVEVGDKAEPRQLKLGASDSDASEVVAGPLKPGDRIITGKGVEDVKKGGIFSGPPESKYKNAKDDTTSTTRRR